MKTLREAVDDAWAEIGRMAVIDNEVPIFEKHIAPLLAPKLGAESLRRAEVARIAEALYCRYQTHSESDMTTDYALQISFLEAEAFIAYRESLELPKKI